MASSAAAAPIKKKIEKTYWTKPQIRRLVEYIEQHGEGKWDQVSKNTGLCNAGKTGSSCRMRWVNHHKSGIDKRDFTEEDDETIIFLRNVVYEGKNKWSQIADALPGRTSNDVKNRWNTKKLWERPTVSGPDQFERILLQVRQDLPEDELDVRQQLFEESINTGGLSRVNSDEQMLFGYTEAPDFDQFSMYSLN